MTSRPRLLVFSDLDGTLLSHDTYAWDAARPALEALAAIGAGVVLASSKTAVEMIPLRADMGLASWPAIVENGAGVLPPGKNARAEVSGYAQIRAVLTQLDPEMRRQFRGFGDMTADEVAKATGLTPQEAELAKTRSASEPGLWSGTKDAEAAFIAALQAQGVHAREGGRFLTLSLGQTKADRMADVIRDVRPTHTIALGDAPNDVEMLQAADYGVIIANPHRAPLAPLPNEDTDTIIRTTLPGPDGWNAAMLALIQKLDLT